MRLGKYTRIFFIFFGVVLLSVIIDNFARGYSPVKNPIFWLAVFIEIGLGYLTYRFWMRSLLVKGFKFDRLMVVGLIVLGVMLPNLFYLSGFRVLNPAGSTDLFYYFTVVCLLVYSSYIIDKYLAKHKPESTKSLKK
ncbi:MAG TPA: hypothetical protein VLH15_01880 [Dehalococcoidales bacterium]|nr:hypothetical protein [Dehalococcoidales bacterium]